MSIMVNIIIFIYFAYVPNTLNETKTKKIYNFDDKSFKHHI